MSQDAPAIEHEVDGDGDCISECPGEPVATAEDSPDSMAGLASFADAVARLTPCTCSGQRARAVAAEAEVERLRRALTPQDVDTIEVGDPADRVLDHGGEYCGADSPRNEGACSLVPGHAPPCIAVGSTTVMAVWTAQPGPVPTGLVLGYVAVEHASLALAGRQSWAGRDHDERWRFMDLAASALRAAGFDVDLSTHTTRHAGAASEGQPGGLRDRGADAAQPSLGWATLLEGAPGTERVEWGVLMGEDGSMDLYDTRGEASDAAVLHGGILTRGVWTLIHTDAPPATASTGGDPT